MVCSVEIGSQNKNHLEDVEWNLFMRKNIISLYLYAQNEEFSHAMNGKPHCTFYFIKLSIIHN